MIHNYASIRPYKRRVTLGSIVVRVMIATPVLIAGLILWAWLWR